MTSELLDSEGAPFVDGAEYTDKYGDTWRAVFDATEFRLVQKADGSVVEGGLAWFEGAESVVRSSGPMAPVAGDSRG